MLRRYGPLLLFAPASCAAPPKAVPVAAPPPPPVIAAPRPVPVGNDWRDWPLTPGTWRYRAGSPSVAAFGAEFQMRCDPATRTVELARAAPAAGTMSVTTSQEVRALATTAAGGFARASLNGRDPFLDKMAFSRGRIVIAMTGTARLVLPAWAEIGRVVEDCRG
ncbi:hypothetical protein [Sphingomonas jatrophae]|nr:hypothetical protein [Sphingomonas jatrophae]